jgi:uncharacterized membrane protein HdeD (DUF308 family)
MSDTGSDGGRSRPEVVTESVVVVSSGGDMVSRYWGLLVAVGIVALVFGIIVLANIWASIHLVAIFAGLFLIFAGVLQFFFGGSAGRTGRIIAGIVAIAAGILLIAWPEVSVKTVAVIVGLSFLIWGIAVAVAAIAARTEGSGVVAGFGAILAVIGVIFIVWPGPTVTLLMVLVGLSAILFGISAIVQGLALRRA